MSESAPLRRLLVSSCLTIVAAAISCGDSDDPVRGGGGTSMAGSGGAAGRGGRAGDGTGNDAGAENDAGAGNDTGSGGTANEAGATSDGGIGGTTNDAGAGNDTGSGGTTNAAGEANDGGLGGTSNDAGAGNDTGNAGTGNTAGTAGTAGTGNDGGSAGTGTAGTGNDGGTKSQGGAGTDGGGAGTGGTAGAGGNEGGVCSGSDTRVCYTGPAETRNVGPCQDGSQTCTNGFWGACEGEITPTADVCNGYDDDCDATTLDGSQDPTRGQRCDGSDTDLCNEGTRGCSNGSYTCNDDTSSTLETCSGDREDEDCNGLYDEGFVQNTNPTCAANVDLGNLAGDSGAEVLTDSHYEERWYRFTLREDPNDVSAYLSATIRLHSPFGTDYDLYVYCANCGGSPIRFSAVGGPYAHDDIVHVRMDDEPGIVDTADIIFEVHLYNETRCAYWDLEVTGNTTVTDTTCP